MVHTLPREVIELSSLGVVVTDFIGLLISNYYTIDATTVHKIGKSI